MCLCIWRSSTVLQDTMINIAQWVTIKLIWALYSVEPEKLSRPFFFIVEQKLYESCHRQALIHKIELAEVHSFWREKLQQTLEKKKNKKKYEFCSGRGGKRNFPGTVSFPREHWVWMIYLVTAISPMGKRKALSECPATSHKQIVAGETQVSPPTPGVLK